MRFVALLGRICFGAVFILSSLGHFGGGLVGYAAAAGVPAPAVAVPVAGALILVGGVFVALGYRARTGAWLIVLFLVAVTPVMHRFWGLPDPQAATMQRVNFMKNLGLLGGALLIAYFGPGPLSLDGRRRPTRGTGRITEAQLIGMFR
jgi:putative oxidoreductase